jgi:CheY-like chemotaxis protein
MFADGLETLTFLKQMENTPFMIISVINMPKMDGFELKREIENDEILSIKAIPFIFLSASAARKDVKTAFYHQAQGYFEKPSDIEGLAKIIKLMIEYWSTSALPLYY